MTREEAPEKLKEPTYDKEIIKQDFEFIANKLGISIDELKGYFDAPNKTYKDYASQENIYKVGAKLLKLFGLEKAGKR